MTKRKKKPTASRPHSHQGGSEANPSKADASTPEPLPLVGLEPTNPPKKNVIFLAATAALFLTWIGVLLWIAFTS